MNWQSKISQEPLKERWRSLNDSLVSRNSNGRTYSIYRSIITESFEMLRHPPLQVFTNKHQFVDFPGTRAKQFITLEEAKKAFEHYVLNNL